MFVEDLSTKTYVAQGENVRAVGWLEADHPFTRGVVPAEFLVTLKLHVAKAHQISFFMGYHNCSLCPKNHEQAGIDNLLIPTADLLCVAPELIVHYIADHGYRPPDEFIAAVMACPPQDSVEFRELLRQFEDTW